MTAVPAVGIFATAYTPIATERIPPIQITIGGVAMVIVGVPAPGRTLRVLPVWSV